MVSRVVQESPSQEGFHWGNDRPLRFLGLDDWGVIDDLSLDEYKELRRRVINEPLEECETLIAQTIIRACALLFSLIESGGLCTTNPRKDIERLRIDIRASLFGYLRWPQHQSRTNRRRIEVDGPRQHLYPLGRAHLLSFINHRIKRYKSCDGDPLLPPLPATASLLKKDLNGELEWLTNLKGKVAWSHIFQMWLDNHLSIIRKRSSSGSWRSVVEFALWQLLKRDRHPIIIAARRGRLISAPIPDEQVNELIFNLPPRRENMPGARNHEPVPEVEIDDDPFAINDGDKSDETEAPISDFSEFEDVGEDTRSTEDINYATVRGFLTQLRKGGITRRQAAQIATDLATSNELLCSPEDELRYLLKWVAELLDKRRTFSTVYTYSSRVLRLLYALYPYPFSKCTTEEMGTYLDDYESVNTVKVVRNTARLFYEYLSKHGLVRTEGIQWFSKTLLAYEQYRERRVLTEQEYQRVRAVTDSSNDPEMRLRRRVLLTLLRRCGLRAVEASWLRPADFRGITECRLRVFRSKTKVGRGRMLPLNLLLDADELAEVFDFIKKRQREGMSAYLFVDSNGERSQPSALAREIEKLLRQAGIKDETAHGLRHAFASSLFAALWLNTVENQANTKGQARRAISSFCRPGVEARAVSHPYHIQLLLGHADLRVTFERYVHLVDLAIADATQTAEYTSEVKEHLSQSIAAQLAGIGKKEFRERLSQSQRLSNKVRLYDVETLLRNQVGCFV